MKLLREIQRLPTSGARAAVPFELDGGLFLAIPQLAVDIDGEPADMNGGSSDVDALIYRWEHAQTPSIDGSLSDCTPATHRPAGAFVEYQRIPAFGGECMSYFTIGARSFLAVAHIRSGRNPNFAYQPYSMVYEWDGLRFYPFQSFPTFAAKHCCFFQIGSRQFIAFAEVVTPPGSTVSNGRSRIYVWNGRRFEMFQGLPSKWGYGFSHFRCDGHDFLALADHAQASVIYRWDGVGFAPFQSLAQGGGGRHFLAFDRGGTSYLAFANLKGDSGLYQWTHESFACVQPLDGTGARNFAHMTHSDELYLFRTNFITGTPKEPTTALESCVYRFRQSRLEIVDSYSTLGGTQSAPFHIDGVPHVAVANSLSAEVRFRTDTIIYRFSQP